MVSPPRPVPPIRLGPHDKVDECALARYTLPRAHVMVHVTRRKGPSGTELMGTEGRAIMATGDHVTRPFVPPDTNHVHGKTGERQIEPNLDWGPGHRYAMANFLDAICSGARPTATGEDGAFVMEAVVGAYESAALGREVALPLSPDDPVYQNGAIGIADHAESARTASNRRGLFGVGAGSFA
jgi:predicted dehydrogenase